jgi:hypothetical protein
MRKVLTILAAVAFVSGVGIAAAHAAIGGGTQGIHALASSYSPVEEAACDSKGMFCRQGSYLRCKPFCFCEPCSKRVKAQKPKR